MQKTIVIKKHYVINGIGGIIVFVLAAILIWRYAKEILITLLVILIIVLLAILLFAGSEVSVAEDSETRVRNEVRLQFRDLGRVIIRTPDPNFLDVSVYDDKDKSKFSQHDWSDLVFGTNGEWMRQGDLTSIIFYMPPKTTDKKFVITIPFDAFEDADADVDQLIADLKLLATRLKQPK